MYQEQDGTMVEEYDESGYVMAGTVLQTSQLPTTANRYAPGARIVTKDTGMMYFNQGTLATPSWGGSSPVLLQKVVPLSAANIIAMYATPVLCIPGVVGKEIYVESVEFDITRTATAFTGGGVVNVQYDSTANGAGTTCHADIAATVVTGAAGQSHTFRVTKDQSDVAQASISGKGLYISNKTAAFAAGTGTAEVTIRYYIA